MTFHENENKWDVVYYGTTLGWFIFESKNTIKAVVINKRFRGQGWLEVIYPEIEKYFNIVLKPSAIIVSPTVLKYWKKKNASLSDTNVLMAEEKMKEVA